MCDDFQPKQTHVFANSKQQDFVLIKMETNPADGTSVYDFRTVDEEDKPTSFALWSKESLISNVVLNAPLPPVVITSAIRYVQTNERARVRYFFDDLQFSPKKVA